MRTIRTIGILGTGIIGASWAAFYAQKGFEVRLFDSQPSALSAGLARAQGFVRHLQELGRLDPAACTAALARLTVSPTLADFAHALDLVQESVAETYAIKREVYSALEAHLPADAVIASSSSGLLMSEIQTALAKPERALIAHPFNPPHLIPLVELVPGARTDPALIEQMKAFFLGLGKEPVVLRKEIPGHIANRLAAALWREAIDLVARGVASVEDVDKALHAGPGMRYALMGQHLIYHLGGGARGYAGFLDGVGKSFEVYWQDFTDFKTLPEGVRAQLIAGAEAEAAAAGKNIEELTRWRDEKLAQLLELKGY